jgi:hypothetical protein
MDQFESIKPESVKEQMREQIVRSIKETMRDAISEGKDTVSFPCTFVNTVVLRKTFGTDAVKFRKVDDEIIIVVDLKPTRAAAISELIDMISEPGEKLAELTFRLES